MNDIFVWKRSENSDCQMWCYVGGRRYLFVNIIIKPKEDTCYGAIYDIDLDNLQFDLNRLDKRDLEYINSFDDDFERASAIADSIECEDCSRETPLFDTEEEMWESVCAIKE